MVTEPSLSHKSKTPELLAALLVSVAAIASAQTYAATTVGGGFACGINNSGQVVGYWSTYLMEYTTHFCTPAGR